MVEPVTAAQTPFADRATQYARDVVSDRVPSCKWHRLACRRHLADIQRANDDGEWPYIWNPVLTDTTGKAYQPAERICKFAELMPHIKGVWAARGLKITLQDWQVFALTSIFGWIHKETGLRRFRVADLFVPRKNAKSTIASVIGLYMLAADGEFGAEVYSGATSQDQAMEVFRPALIMARTTPGYRRAYGVQPNASNLSVLDTNSKFEPVIGKPGDGASPSCAIVDEYHEHKTPELYETMQTGMGARSQPLMLVITTAGSDLSGPCYMHQVELQKILEGVLDNDQRFGVIFGIDDGDDWTSEAALRKANPNYGISVDAEFLRTQQRDAIADPRKQNTFKTKHLNTWVAAASPWLNLHRLQLAGDPTITLESMRGKPCVVGLDLASKVDVASCVFLFREEIDGEHHYTAISRNYLPEAAIEKPENAHYQAWVHGGHITATAGNMINLRQIQEDIIEAAETVVITEIAMDSWGSREIAPNLQEEGFTVVDIPMQVRHLSDPMKSIAALVDDGRFHHDGNPAYVWMLSNVECSEDRNDNIFPRKARKQNKIDAAVATIIAKARASVPAPVFVEPRIEVW